MSSALSISNLINGQIINDDILNPDDTNGTMLYDTTKDWLSFENSFRTYGKTGLSFPNIDNQSRCATPETCQIWDYRLNETDTVAFNFHGQASQNNICPNSVNGDVTLTDLNTFPNTFLEHAIEIMNDTLGDNDGLCESNEACVYSPHVGAFQGLELKNNKQCLFQNGITSDAVTGVTMFIR